MTRDRFLLCPPRFYGVEYVINPWMQGNIGRARQELAARQWEGLRNALAARADLELVEPVRGLPDMPFTANAGLVCDDIFLPSRFRFRQRQPETKHFGHWFSTAGYRIVELPGHGTFEGEGDVLFQPGRALAWCGYGLRTSLQAHHCVAETLNVEVVPLRLIDERFYHLDTCLCPLPNGRLLYYPGAFDRDSLDVIARRVPPADRIAVESADALQFTCNAIVTGDSLITNSASDGLRDRLARSGIETIVCPLGEFLLAGGGAKCLVLRLEQDLGPAAGRRAHSDIRDRLVEVEGHLLDRGLLNRILDDITASGGSFEVEEFQPGFRRHQDSWTRIRVAAPTPQGLDRILRGLGQLGVRSVDGESDAHLEIVIQAGVAPESFYGTTIYPTEVRIVGRWIRARRQRMDAVLVVTESAGVPDVECRLIRDLQPGDRVVCGADGVRSQPGLIPRAHAAFEFMRADVSSERRVELAVERIAWEMRRIRERRGRIVVVAGPVIIHTGAGPRLAALIRGGYVQALLSGNGLAAHDIEQALFGTSLGIDLERGTPVPGGHQHHLRAINRIRACGGIAEAVRQGVLTSGAMYECIQKGVPFALAGSIRDDGPLPETFMDLIAAQAAYARLIEGADMILMLSSMLSSIGVGNMTPAGVRLVCVDISPAVVTKLADRGSVESVGVVTDAGLFLNLLDQRLKDQNAG